MKSIHHTVLEQIRSGSGKVLATVVRTAGSTPQKPGSSALFGESGLLAGTVGGGLLEGEVQHIAGNVIISGISDQFYFNLDSDPGEEGAICGGDAEVLIDASPSAHLAVLEELEESLSRREEGFLLTLVSRKHDRGRTIRRFWINRDGGTRQLPELEQTLRESVTNHLKHATRYGFIEVGHIQESGDQTDMAYLEHFKPRPHLIIAGGGHIGKALAHHGKLLEFEVTVIDDREEFANSRHIPDADHLVCQEIGPALSELEFEPDTYLVIVTRGHKQDEEALKVCIGSEAAYIGMIGSTHKVGIVKKQFLEEKWSTEEEWSAVYTPIGLSIGSKTVEEIAISIAAQLVEVRNQKKEHHEA